MTEEELKDWIEMKKIRTKKYDNSVWIPLYEFTLKKEGEHFYPDLNPKLLANYVQLYEL